MTKSSVIENEADYIDCVKLNIVEISSRFKEREMNRDIGFSGYRVRGYYYCIKLTMTVTEVVRRFLTNYVFGEGKHKSGEVSQHHLCLKKESN